MVFFFCVIWLAQMAHVSSQGVCPPPPGFLFGHLEPGPHTVGSVRTYTCKNGYQPMGDATIRCRNDLTWTPLKLSCLTCPPPEPEFGCGQISSGLDTLYTTRTYVCKVGFEASTPVKTQCLPGTNGPAWSVPDTECRGCQSQPPSNQGGQSVSPGTNPSDGPITAFRCTTGLITIGQGEISCINQNGISLWKKPVPGCTTPFSSPGTNPSAGPIIAYRCTTGLITIGPREISCINHNGISLWKKPVPGCTSALAAAAVTISDSCKGNPCLNGGKCENIPTGYKCRCSGGYHGTKCEVLDVKTGCEEILSSRIGEGTGVYTIQPKGLEKFKVVCDMKTDGGGWTVIQSRLSVHDTNFDKPWKDYRDGFGTVDPAHSFWLGLEKVHQMTKQGKYEVWIEMEKRNGVKGAAVYQNFRLDDEKQSYKLRFGTYSAYKGVGFIDPGDSLRVHHGAKFSAHDRKNAGFPGHGGRGSINCASQAKGGWWYIESSCYFADVNGQTAWQKFDKWTPLFKTKMMIRKKITSPEPTAQ